MGTGRIGRAGAGKTGGGWREGWGLGTAGARRRSRVLGHGHAGARTSQQHGGRACLQGSELRAQRRLLQRGPEAGGGGKYPVPPLGCPLPSHRPSGWQNLLGNGKAREQWRQLPVIQTRTRQTDTERQHRGQHGSGSQTPAVRAGPSAAAPLPKEQDTRGFPLPLPTCPPATAVGEVRPAAHRALFWKAPRAFSPSWALPAGAAPPLSPGLSQSRNVWEG